MRSCAVDGCIKPHHSHGWCSMHYARWKKSGDPGTAEPLKLVGAPVEDRFWFYVSKRESCWLWTGGLNEYGYGKFNPDRRRPVLSHRFAWTITHGPIASGLNVLHRCDNPPCVNPAHLFLGTQGDNMHDMHAKGRASSQSQTHCKQGHPFDERNTGIVPGSGHRYCRTCHRERSAERYRRLRAGITVA